MSVPDPEHAVVRRHIRVTGRVQNVTYRDSTQEEAQRRGVAGWVRNLPDGSVEAELEGPGSAIDQVLRWMQKGPLLAKVEDLEITIVPPTGAESFEVR
jgi:acylphosphatase